MNQPGLGEFFLSESATSPAWQNWARCWGILVLGALFGVGGYFLFRRSLEDWRLLREGGEPPFAPGLVYALYALVGLVGLVKGEIIFRRKVLARSLARARQAVGETGWIGDLPLAPFCLLSMYRPWKPAHAISSWVIIPIMVGLAFFFRFGLGLLGMGDATQAIVRGPIYFGIGLALAYGSGVYAVYLLRLVAWWLTAPTPETIPLPALEPGR
jgi:hypothetical protein